MRYLWGSARAGCLLDELTSATRTPQASVSERRFRPQPVRFQHSIEAPTRQPFDVPTSKKVEAIETPGAFDERACRLLGIVSGAEAHNWSVRRPDERLRMSHALRARVVLGEDLLGLTEVALRWTCDRRSLRHEVRRRYNPH